MRWSWAQLGHKPSRALLLNDFIPPTYTYGGIVRLRAVLAHRPASRQASTSDQSQIANKTRSKTTGAAPAWASAVGSVGIVRTRSQLSTTPAVRNMVPLSNCRL